MLLSKFDKDVDNIYGSFVRDGNATWSRRWIFNVYESNNIAFVESRSVIDVLYSSAHVNFAVTVVYQCALRDDFMGECGIVYRFIYHGYDSTGDIMFSSSVCHILWAPTTSRLTLITVYMFMTLFIWRGQTAFFHICYSFIVVLSKICHFCKGLGLMNIKLLQ